MILLMVLLSQLCSSSLECLEFLCKVLSQLNIRNVESSQEVLRIDSCCIGITNDRKSLFVSLFFFFFFPWLYIHFYKYKRYFYLYRKLQEHKFTSPGFLHSWIFCQMLYLDSNWRYKLTLACSAVVLSKASEINVTCTDH